MRHKVLGMEDKFHTYFFFYFKFSSFPLFTFPSYKMHGVQHKTCNFRLILPILLAVCNSLSQNPTLDYVCNIPYEKDFSMTAHCFRVKVLECSAKDDYNVKEIFRCFLTLSRILPAGGDESSGGLKRRSSAYVSASSKNMAGRRTGSPALESTGTSAAASSEGATGGLEVTRSKPRSRSLIRRSSRKAKQQMRDAHDDCNIS